MSNINAAIVVSDLHAGSTVGLACPEVKLESGNIVTFGDNLHQQWLWETWMYCHEIAKNMLAGANTALIINGDAVEGTHHRTIEITAPTIIEHLRIAEECLKPFAELSQAVFVTKGTECHTQGMEDELANRLGAETGKAKDKWLIDINGCLIDVAHHMVTTKRIYLEASGMGITLGNARQNYASAGHRIPDLFLRAHRHCGGVYTQRGSALAVTGGFQWLTRYANKVVTDAIPMPTILVMDWRNVPEGSLPTFHEIFRKPPQSKITHA